MDQDIKNEFENISKKFTEEIGSLARAVKEGFDDVDQRFEGIETTMATKSELNQLRSATNAGFASQQLEISLVQEKLTVLDDKMDKLYRMETEDMRVLDLDMKKVKQQLALT